MSIQQQDYKASIGLEIHAQLSTQSKMFAPETTSYGELPNTQVSHVTLAHPGTLPTINKKAIEYALKMGIACHTTITEHNYFARKNYFYPDLPKGYQITQDKTPICSQGWVYLTDAVDEQKKVRITRIHLEEDTGKSLHDLLPNTTLLDLNRAGTPLIEIVTEPDMHTSDEVAKLVNTIRRLLRYLDICDGNMEEGSLRCDVNVSVAPQDAKKLGTRVEIKNLNTIGSVQAAINYEIQRQTNLLLTGGKVTQQTRSYNANTDKTVLQRAKETLSEYRYFPEPDLSPLIISKSWVEALKERMPLLPRAWFKRLTHTYALSDYDAEVLLQDKQLVNFFEVVCTHTKAYKVAANWILGPIKSHLNDKKLTIGQMTISPQTLARVVEIVAEGKCSFSMAAQTLFPALIEAPNTDPYALAEKLAILQTNDADQLEEWVTQVITDHPVEVKRYQAGKKGLLGFFMAEVMKVSHKKADPKATSQLLEKTLKTRNIQ